MTWLMQHMVQQLSVKPKKPYADMKQGNGDYNLKPCVICGKEFKPKNGNHNTCSTVCSIKQKNATRRQRRKELMGYET